MKRAVKIILGLCVVGFVAIRVLIGGQTVSWHQRLTVTIQTPAGEVSGSSVTAVKLTSFMGSLVVPDAQGVQSVITGEAVVVEVTPGRYLFALLDGGDGWKTDAGHWVYAAFPLDEVKTYEAKMSRLKAQKRNTPVPLPPEGWPLMVTFTDINRPETVERVNPEDLAASFGPGVSLKGLTLEVTRDRVTRGAVERFQFWPILRKQRTFSGLQFFDSELPDPLNYLNFDVLVKDNLQ